MRRIAGFAALVALGSGIAAAPGHLAPHDAGPADFTHFESAHVHPAVLTPDGTRLLVVNTPDNRLSVFDVTGDEPLRIAEIPVGLEPVSVAALDDRTAWVVNNLSDDVSIVDLVTMHVKSTLRVGDEPNDVVFAGSPRRAYVSVSQEDRIRVYDPANLSAAPLDIPINGRFPRSLATNAAGTSVYAAVFFAGNRTSVLSFQEVPADSQPQDPNFPRSAALTAEHGAGPRVGLIVQQQGDDWRDMYGKLWNHKAPYRVSDVDVAEIPAGAASPSRTFGDIGTTNYAIAVSPSDGRVAVAGTEARNLLRFEPRLRGHSVDTRVGFITTAGATSITNLNPHVNYEGPGTAAERDSALGTPTGIAYSGDGRRTYVTSLASDKLGVLDPLTGALLARVPTVAGPTGVVADDARGRVYVVGRFRNQLQTLSSATLREVSRTGIGFDPTPDVIVNGRKFFYGGFTSAHGEQSCASCHVFGDFDNLAWDLGNPAGHFDPPPAGMNDPLLEGFDPMKGPMTTQTLRALPGTGRLHWRADRLDLAAFNPAFVELMGMTSQLPDSEMTAFSHFVNPLANPPNPSQHLNRTMPDAPFGQPSARRGQLFFNDRPVDRDRTCNFCHKPTNGTDGQVINDERILQDQDMKTPHLRNLYRKTGFDDRPGAVSKRGFGFAHDGSFATVFDFLKQPNFEFDPGPDGDEARRDVEAFVLAFDTGTAPSVGCQITFDASNVGRLDLLSRLDTLATQSVAANCELIARGRVNGQPRGWRYRNDGTWRPDKAAEPAISTGSLLALAGSGTEIAILGVPRGSGERMGNDRDRDGHRDGDELDAGSDPGRPQSMPMPGNTRPMVDAGPNLSVTLPSSASLAGHAMDDGVPHPATLAVRWRKVSGPGAVTFANPRAAVTTASFSLPGTYTLELSGSDGMLTTLDVTNVAVTAPCGATVERRVAAGADDAEESASGSVSLTSSDLELTMDGSLQTVGMRFTGIDVPQGAVITRAYVQFTAHEARSEATALQIRGQDADTAAAFTTASLNVSSRPRTDAVVAWTPVAWPTVGAAGADQRTPDLSAVVQEIVDRPGWQSRSLALIVTGTGRRTAKSFDGLAAGAALLHVEYGCGNRRPSVDAGADQTFSFDPSRTAGGPQFERGGVGLEHDIPSTSLRGRVTDDGLPDPPARVTSVWRRVSGPGGVFFVDSLSPATIVTFPDAGVYVLSLTATDGELTATDQVTITVNAMANVVERAVAAGSDDVEEQASGAVSLTSSDLEMMLDGSSPQRAVGMRFAGLSIPPRAIITRAWVQFRSKEARTDPTQLVVRAHAVDNAPTFASANGNVTSRPLTVAEAPWSDVPAWTANQATAAQRTGDLKDVIQEIVNRPGWAGGNAIALVVTGTGRRVAHSFENGAANAPVLHVEYSTGNHHNHPPPPGGAWTVMAGPDTTVPLSGAVNLRGQVFYNPQTPPTLYMWRRVLGPGLVTFDNGGALATRATFGAPGLYHLELMAMDNAYMVHDTVAVTVTDPRPTIVEARVAAGADDVEEQASGSVSLTSSDLEMMLDGASPQRAVGVRFTNLAIPPGSVIASAWIQFRAKEARADVTNLVVRGQAVDSAPAFASASGNVTARALTTAQAAWSAVPAWTANQITAAQRTPELKDVIQEIVSRPGWASGNAMAFVVTGTGRRVANSYESGAANAPLLHVEYAAAPPPPPPVVNQPPYANAGPDTTVVWNGTSGVAMLHGQAGDDGIPGPLMAHWIPLSGPGLVTFDNHMAMVTRATFGAIGIYRLQFMAMDGSFDTSDTISVIVTAPGSSNRAPVAALSVTPPDGVAPLSVLIDASASTDPDGDALTYTFDFGDAPPEAMACGPDGSCCCYPAPCLCHGAVAKNPKTSLDAVAAAAGPVATHAYAAGTWTVTVVVRDGRGGADTTTAVVNAYTNLAKNPSFETNLTGWNANGTRATVARVAGGRTGGFCIEARGDSLPANTFGINDSPNVVSPAAGAGARYRFSAWVRSESHSGKVQIKVREYLSGVLVGTQYVSPLTTLTPAWQRLTLEVAATVNGSTLDFQVMNKPIVGREVFQVDDVEVYPIPAPAPIAGSITLEGPAIPATPTTDVGVFGAKLYPNPPGAMATIDLVTTREGPVSARIFDAQGRLMRTLLDEPALPAGRHALRFETRGASRMDAGLYFFSVQSPEGRLNGKFVIVR